MKQIKLIVSILLAFVIFNSLVFATSEDSAYIYTDESGELITSDEYEYDDDATLITNQDDLYELYDDNSNDQEALKEAFESQTAEIAGLVEASEENNQELIITKILSDIKSEYTSDGYYYYIIKYQLANVKNSDGTELPSVVILSYDVSDDQNVTPLKQGDKVYGYFQTVSSDDSSSYSLVQHGLEDEEIAYVSITERDRSLGITLLIAFSILLMLLYAGNNGAKVLIPIFTTLDLLFFVLVPEVEIGKKLLIIAILAALELIVLITVLKNGINKKTSVAIITSIIVVTLISVFAYLFANTNAISGKGLINEEHYDLSSNVYYIDRLFKGTVDTTALYISIIIIISAVISAIISSKLTEFSAKYAGSKDIINNIISEGKTTISEYPLIIAIIFLAFDLPKIMTIIYSHIPLNQILNSETIITDASILLFAIISTLITLPIHAIVSNIFMSDVEVKQISADNK